jgi:hypothetical protein
MDGMDLRRSMWLSITECALATAMGTLLSGVFPTGFALSLGANQLEVGILAALPAISNVAQLAGSVWLERRRQRKLLCVSTLALSRLLWLPLLFVPLMEHEGRRGMLVWGLLGLVALSSVLCGIGAVAWLSWIRDLIPIPKRVRFLAIRNQFDTALALSLSIIGAAFSDWWVARWPGTHGGFVTVFAAALVCGLIGIFFC